MVIAKRAGFEVYLDKGARVRKVGVENPRASLELLHCSVQFAGKGGGGGEAKGRPWRSRDRRSRLASSLAILASSNSSSSFSSSPSSAA